MTTREFRERLTRRLAKVGVALPDDAAVTKLATYVALMSRWNAKINLTALPLDKPTDETFDRLLVEPIVAARHFPESAAAWFDLGSGGGSPALPLKILRPSVRLTMVESKVRKAAFLREAVRALELPEAFVENSRFEDVAQRTPGSAQVVTVRAVRPDSALFKISAELLCAGGRLLLFGPPQKPALLNRLVHLETAPLIEARRSYLAIYAIYGRG